jgi:hypothetical protein
MFLAFTVPVFAPQLWTNERVFRKKIMHEDTSSGVSAFFTEMAMEQLLESEPVCQSHGTFPLEGECASPKAPKRAASTNEGDSEAATAKKPRSEMPWGAATETADPVKEADAQYEDGGLSEIKWFPLLSVTFVCLEYRCAST